MDIGTSDESKTVKNVIAIYRVSGWKVSKIKKISETNCQTHTPFMSSKRKTVNFFFHARFTRMRELMTFGELSNNVDTTGTGSMRFAASRFAVRTSISYMEKHSDSKLRTTGSLLRVKSPGKTWTLKKMSISLERHSSEVRANQFVLLACSYLNKFHIQ
jgi:hypothetical protein